MSIYVCHRPLNITIAHFPFFLETFMSCTKRRAVFENRNKRHWYFELDWCLSVHSLRWDFYLIGLSVSFGPTELHRKNRESYNYQSIEAENQQHFVAFVLHLLVLFRTNPVSYVVNRHDNTVRCQVKKQQKNWPQLPSMSQKNL